VRARRGVGGPDGARCLRRQRRGHRSARATEQCHPGTEPDPQAGAVADTGAAADACADACAHARAIAGALTGTRTHADPCAGTRSYAGPGARTAGACSDTAARRQRDGHHRRGGRRACDLAADLRRGRVRQRRQHAERAERPINRHGGNATSLYNWQANASNRGMDWYFESIDEGSATAGQSLLSLVAANRQAQATSMITIGMTGWVAKLGPARAKTACFSIAKYGAQAGNDAQWMPDAGNGVRAGGGNVTGNDPHDCAQAADADSQKGLVQLLTSTHGNAASGGVRFYVMDNETALWHSTHRAVHPQPASMDEIFGAISSYGAMVKSVDPQALVVGPEEWGWSNYFASARDGALNQWWNGSDRAAHGGMDYMPWLLKALHERHQQTGQRVLDVFSLHYYPQGGEFSNDTSAAMQRTRNQSTRSLWDPNYVDKSWINDKVQLIPRMKGWIDQHYPGTQIAITEYSWGADDHINGATAQADVLGILGREGVDIATRWTAPAAASVTFKAFQMYRNVDGAKQGFGERAVRASVPDPDTLSAFAALRASDGALTVMVVHKDASTARSVNLQLANFSGTTVQRWQLTSANRIQALGTLALAGGRVLDTVPAQSITLYAIR